MKKKRLNNKGQVLVCFILLIPIILTSLSMVVDLGLFSLEKRKMSNAIKDAVEYGSKHLEDNNIDMTLKDLIKSNIEDVTDKDINVYIDNSYIEIKVEKKYSGPFRLVTNQEIEISYSKNNDELIKEE